MRWRRSLWLWLLRGALLLLLLLLLLLRSWLLRGLRRPRTLWVTGLRLRALLALRAGALLWWL